MMEETLDTVDDDEIEEEADAEVDKVLFELTDGKLGQAGKVGGELPVSSSVRTSSPSSRQADKEDEEDVAEMQRMEREMQDLLSG
jgi:charged multivesicular body protein 3